MMVASCPTSTDAIGVMVLADEIEEPGIELGGPGRRHTEVGTEIQARDDPGCPPGSVAEPGKEVVDLLDERPMVENLTDHRCCGLCIGLAANQAGSVATDSLILSIHKKNLEAILFFQHCPPLFCRAKTGSRKLAEN